MTKTLPYLFFLCVTIQLLASCKDNYNICDESKNVFFKAGFYTASMGSESIHIAPSFSLALVGNNFIYNQQINISKFSFALNPIIDSASYFIRVSNSLPADTLTIIYNSQNMVISPECGSVFISTITSAHTTYNTIDSLKISNAVADLSGNENIKIYF